MCQLPVWWREIETRIGNVFHKLDMTGHKYFFENRVKIEKGTLSKGVAEKDTRIEFGIEFAGRIETQPGKT